MAAVAAASLAGCGLHTAGASSRSPQAAQAFLSQVHGKAPDIGSYRSDAKLVSLGRAVCDDLSSGVSLQRVADRLETVNAAHPLPSEDLGAVMAAAGTTLCPKYQSLFGSGT